MQSRVTIEDIESMRHQQGINDVDLRQQVRSLRVGDVVQLTFLSEAAAAGETLPVRITRVRGSVFHGELTRKPTVAGLSGLRAGSPVVFAAVHIHSLPSRQIAAEDRSARARIRPGAKALRNGAAPLPLALRRGRQLPLIDTRVKGNPMQTKAPPSSRAAAPRARKQPLAAASAPSPTSTSDHLQRIGAMGERVSGYIQFMCAVGTLSGTSAEAKERAVADFYEQMVVLERELGRIAEELQLG